MSLSFWHFYGKLELIGSCFCHSVESFFGHILVKFFIECRVHFDSGEKLRVECQPPCLGIRIERPCPSTFFGWVCITPSRTSYENLAHNLLQISTICIEDK